MNGKISIFPSLLDRRPNRIEKLKQRRFSIIDNGKCMLKNDVSKKQIFRMLQKRFYLICAGTDRTAPVNMRRK